MAKNTKDYPSMYEEYKNRIERGEKEEVYNEMMQLDDVDYINLIRLSEAADLPLAKTYLHTHTDLGSPKDSVLTTDKYISHAKAAHASSITVTDHGTMYAVQPLYNACVKAGLKLIVGTELYVCDNADDKSVKKHTRLHLIAYAMNKKGYDAVSALVTEGYKHVLSVAGLEFPCVSKKILEEYVGEGAEGHGNVILTSACIGGVIAGVCHANRDSQKNADELQDKVEKLKQMRDSYSSLSKQIAEITAKLPDQERIATRKFTKRASLGIDPETLEKEKKETEEMAEIVKAEKLQIRSLRRTSTALQKQVDAIASSASGTAVSYCTEPQIRTIISKLEAQIKQLNDSIVKIDNLSDFFEQEMLWYDNLAGHGNWFIELQNHGIKEELQYMPYLYRAAIKLHIPYVAANDAHMETAGDLMTRKAVNSLRFNNWEEPKTGDSELYLKSDAQLYKALCDIVPPRAAAQALHNRLLITERCNLELKKEPHYPKYVV